MELSAGSSSNTNPSTTSEASFNSGDATSESSSHSRDPHAELVDELEHHPFTTSATLIRAVETRREALQRGITRDQYLVYAGVPPEVFSKLVEEKSRVNKSSRFTYSNNTGTLIIKVMLHPEHDIAARRFDLLIASELDTMGVHDIDPLGSTTVTIGSWKKEADCSWGPFQQRAELNLAVEIGLSESMRHLATDARGWLETPSSTVKLVVTISIDRTQPEVVFRRWELAPRSYRLVTRSSPASARNSSTTRVYRVNNTTSVDGGELVLPFDKIVGRQATGPHERDIILSEGALQDYAERLWVRQGFM
ncbi:uncharacterized protein P174DRAFT_512809 [Aspergillus novofumigatus IBT 16806]|uniref:Uncharacterized protein n=1 Tax=Aspergillus novofumigatus (strain IBT 16806) TaxID=1392255 RepID=A0A2I1CAS7_ASPN1|nr:uncharacterized protein P174DRAFT_512809 [Aspergillus novofumigatus IBT 16806]PKX94696.1 hypothetical protein P174DRAFT_512809 [Aspergillus novofumigatus IBT 16806]